MSGRRTRHTRSTSATRPPGRMATGTGPAPPRDARLTGAGLSDVTLSWDPSADDGAGEDDVVAYLVYASAAFDPQGAGYALLATLPAGTTILRVAAAGVGDPQKRFYRPVTMEASGRTAASPDQVAEYR